MFKNDAFTLNVPFKFQAKEAENLIKLLRKDSNKVIIHFYSYKRERKKIC